MPDPYAVANALRDPRLQTGPFPQWPTLPPMSQPQPRYLENDPTPWEGGDFSSANATPMAIVMALLSARAGRKSGTPQSNAEILRGFDQRARQSPLFDMSHFQGGTYPGDIPRQLKDQLAPAVSLPNTPRSALEEMIARAQETSARRAKGE